MMSSNPIIHSPEFFDEIRKILAQARHKAYAAINFAMAEALEAASRFGQQVLQVIQVIAVQRVGGVVEARRHGVH